jgi:ATP-binding cassette subfamily F protein uup
MMLHSVANTIIALDGNGGAEAFSDYEQCEEMLDRFIPTSQSGKSNQSNQGGKSNQAAKSNQTAKDKKGRNKQDSEELSSAEKRELSALPERIEKLETELKSLHKEMEVPSVAANYTKLQDLDKQQKFKQKELEAMFARWEQLEAKEAALKA